MFYIRQNTVTLVGLRKKIDTKHLQVGYCGTGLGSSSKYMLEFLRFVFYVKGICSFHINLKVFNFVI